VRRLSDDPALARHRDALTAHFGMALPFPLEVQTAALPGARRAMLILGPPEAREPLILVTDAGGATSWIKERPLAGIVPGVRELALLGGPEGGVSLAFCDPAGKLGALRQWDADGGIVADYEVLDLTSCDAISALHWPGQGFVVAASGAAPARAQLLDGSGRRAWGRAGLELPWKPAAGAPVTIAPDTDATVVLLQVGAAGEPGGRPGAPAAMAMRFDVHGTALWPRPIAVGRPSAPPAARLVVRATGAGALRVELAPGPAPRAVELTPEGQVNVAPPRR
jgi:hypothetical protein